MQTKLGTYTSRKIEVAMCAAVADLREWRCDNTEVELHRDCSITDARYYAVVRLHGHAIATVVQARHDTMRVIVDESTLRQWPTNTTLSRLRALGADVRVAKRIVYLNGEAITER